MSFLDEGGLASISDVAAAKHHSLEWYRLRFLPCLGRRRRRTRVSQRPMFYVPVPAGSIHRIGPYKYS